MSVSLKHAKTSTVPDSGDPTLVQGSDWNSEHNLQCASGNFLGRQTSGTGAVEEIPISGFATTTALSGKADKATTLSGYGITDGVSSSLLGAASGVATLGSDSKLTASQIPDISIVTYLGSVASQAAMLALTGQQGDWCTRSDLGTNWIITGANPALLASWTQLSYPTAPVTSVNSKTGAVTLSNTDVGAQATITATGLLKGAGAGSVSAAVSGTDYAPATSGSAILKGDAAGGFANAVAKTDYAPATTGSAILKGDGAGGFSSAASGTDYQAPIGTISGIAKGNGANALTAATAGTDYSAGTSALATGILKSTTTTGALSIAVGGTDYQTAQSVTGLVKSSGTTRSAATAGTDYLAPPTGTAILKANSGGALANAVAGTDYQAPIGTISGIAKGNGANALTAAVAGTDYLAPPTGTAILKANAGGALANAVSGTDYAPATSGSSILYGNGAGGFSNVTVGSGLTFSAGTLTASATGISVSNDTSTASNLYPIFASFTSGTLSAVRTGNSKLLYKPSTGELTATNMISSGGISCNANAISANYTIATGRNGLSAGPVTVNAGVTVTISSGSTWKVV